MARTEARIKTSIWIDDVFLAMEPLSKFLYMALLSQPKLNHCGVMSYTPTSWANLTGLSREDVVLAAKRLQDGNFLEVDESTEELWIRTLTKNDGVLKAPYMMVAATKDFGTIQSRRIRDRFLDELGPSFVRDAANKFKTAFETKPFAEPFMDAFNERFNQ